MAASGQGAPLVARVDALLFGHVRLHRAPAEHRRHRERDLRAGRNAEAAFALDTGPGNMLIDDAAQRTTGGALDYGRDGALAAASRVDEGWLAELLAHGYFRRPPPKTTGRELFGRQYGAELCAQAGARPTWRGHHRYADRADRLFDCRGLPRLLPIFPNEVIVSGGGAQPGAEAACIRAGGGRRFTACAARSRTSLACPSRQRRPSCLSSPTKRGMDARATCPRRRCAAAGRPRQHHAGVRSNSFRRFASLREPLWNQI